MRDILIERLRHLETEQLQLRAGLEQHEQQGIDLRTRLVQVQGAITELRRLLHPQTVVVGETEQMLGPGQIPPGN